MNCKAVISALSFTLLSTFFLPHWLFAAPKGSASPGSENQQKSHTKGGRIEAIMRRSDSIRSISGLAKIKIHTPKMNKGFKAAILLDSNGSIRVDGLTPFGTAALYLVYEKNNLLVHDPSSGMLYLDYLLMKDLLGYMDFPDTGYSLLELISGSFLNRRISGEASLGEVEEGKEFLLRVKRGGNAGSFKVTLDASFLPKKAVIFLEKGKGFAATYSNYQNIQGFQFPFKSVFRIPKEKITVEFSFSNLRIADQFSQKDFSVPISASPNFVSRKEVAFQLNLNSSKPSGSTP